MYKWIISVLLCLVFQSHLFCEEEFLIYDYFEETIIDCDTGCYEKNEYVIFHVKNKRNLKKPNRMREEALAFEQAFMQIRKWCIDYFQKNSKEDEKNWFITSILDKYWAEWKSSDWRISNITSMQLMNEVDGQFYIYSLAIKKEHLINSCLEFMNSCLKIVAKKEITKDNDFEFYKTCGAIDFTKNYKFENAKINEEYESLEGEIESHYNSSKYIAYLKGEQEKIKQLILAKQILFVEDVLSTPSNSINVIVTTNKIENVSKTVTTNTVMKTLENGVIAKLEESKIKVPYVVEVVETKIIKTNYFEEEITYNQVNQFENLVYSKGENIPQPQSPMGLAKVAKESFVDNSLSIEKKQKDIENALRENPADADMWSLYGQLFYNNNDFYHAIVFFRIALKINPKHENALVNLCASYLQVGKVELAKGLYPIAICYSETKSTNKKLREMFKKFK